jgi:hypothetical protein
LAHETAHTIQQHPGLGSGASIDSENEADRFADQAASSAAREAEPIPIANALPIGLARKVIWKWTQDLPGGLLLIVDVDDGDFVGGCLRAIVPHVGIKLVNKVPHFQIFNLHVGFVTNAKGEACIFFYESVSNICEMLCFESEEERDKSWEKIKEWLKDLIKKVLIALAIAALLVGLFLLAELIVDAILAALAALAALLAAALA